jgi:hypothetical protein
MGLYDRLRVEAALPDPELQGRTFQTKSLECALLDYTITHDGHLIETVYEGHFVDDETAFLKMRFERTGQHRVELSDFHGDIVFYVTVNAPDEAIYAIDFKEGTTSIITADGTTTPFEPVVVYYKARFTDGRLAWIRRISREEADEW